MKKIITILSMFSVFSICSSFDLNKDIKELQVQIEKNILQLEGIINSSQPLSHNVSDSLTQEQFSVQKELLQGQESMNRHEIAKEMETQFLGIVSKTMSNMAKSFSECSKLSKETEGCLLDIAKKGSERPILSLEGERQIADMISKAISSAEQNGVNSKKTFLDKVGLIYELIRKYESLFQSYSFILRLFDKK